jgi:hypothetical protein
VEVFRSLKPQAGLALLPLLLLRFLKFLIHPPSLMNRQLQPFPSHSPEFKRHLSHLRHPPSSHPHRSLLRSRSSRLRPIDRSRKSHYQSHLFRISLPTPRSLRVRAYRHLSPSLHPNLILRLRTRPLRPASPSQRQQYQYQNPRVPLHPYLAQLSHNPLPQRQVQNLKSPFSLFFRPRHHPSLDLPCKLN